MSPFSSRLSALSLRSKVFAAASALAIPTLVGMALLLWMMAHARGDLARATDSFVEEQQIADRIQRGVMRQLTEIAVLPVVVDRAADGGDFWMTGEDVHDEMRRYLFRDLSVGQRRVLESMAEEHRRLEVAAARASDLLRRGLDAEAEEARGAMVLHAFELLEEIDEFLGMREAELVGLQERQDAAVRLLAWAGSALASLFLLTGFLLLWGLHRRVSDPLEDLALAAERIAAGDLDVQVPLGHDREFQMVSAGFNHMAANLRRIRSNLEERNAELSAALDTLRKTQAELIQSEKLSAMGRMAAGVAHELNNPLTSVVGYAQLMAEQLADGGPASTEAVVEAHLHPILDEANRAGRLVRNFLRFSRDSEVELGPVPLGEVLEVVVGLREHAFRNHGLGLHVDEAGELEVRADRDLLQSVILNVVNNAEDAMRPTGSGELRVRVLERRGMVELVFEDDGPGFADTERVFEPFFTTKPVGEGTGLGLALVHRFVSQFGGTVRVGNRVEGGARVSVSLRIATRGERGPARDGIEVDPVPATPGAVPDTDAPRILVVEDEAPLRELQRRILEGVGATVFLAADAAEARRIIAEEELDAVLSDVKMPGESGLGLYRWILRDHPHLAARFLFVTGDVSGKELLELLDRAPELFIHKPFDVEDYVCRVWEMLSAVTS